MSAPPDPPCKVLFGGWQVRCMHCWLLANARALFSSGTPQWAAGYPERLLAHVPQRKVCTSPATLGVLGCRLEGDVVA
jgi:hypothetical protein